MQYFLRPLSSFFALTLALTACSPGLLTAIQSDLTKNPPIATTKSSSVPPLVPLASPPPSQPNPASPLPSPQTTLLPQPLPTASEDPICFPNAGETIRGKIVDTSGKPVPGVQVSLKVLQPEIEARCPQTAFMKTASTSDGTYTFEKGVIGGVKMELKMSQTGYISQSQLLVPITNRVGESINRYDVTMQPNQLNIRPLRQLPAGRSESSAVVYKQQIYVLGG